MNELVVHATPVSPFVRKVDAILRTLGVSGQDSDLETARKTYQKELTRRKI